MLLIIMAIIIMRRKKQKYIIEDKKKKKSPKESAMIELQKLEKALMDNALSIRSVYFKLTEVLCEFISDELKVNVLDATTVEMKRILKMTKAMKTKEFDQVMAISHELDHYKFSEDPMFDAIRCNNMIQQIKSVIEAISMIVKYPMALLLIVPVCMILWLMQPIIVAYNTISKSAGMTHLRSKKSGTFSINDQMDGICGNYGSNHCHIPTTDYKGKSFSNKKGIDIVAILDTSKSMTAEDFKPKNRMAVAKDTLKEFIKKRKMIGWV